MVRDKASAVSTKHRALHALGLDPPLQGGALGARRDSVQPHVPSELLPALGHCPLHRHSVWRRRGPAGSGVAGRPAGYQLEDEEHIIRVIAPVNQKLYHFLELRKK